MFKRILILGTGLLLGVALSFGAARVALALNWWPSRELSHTSDYFREVLQMVHENYVDPKASNYDHLAKNAIHGMVESLDRIPNFSS